MKVPQRLCIVLTVDGHPLKGVPVLVTFVMGRKNNHDLVFGPSNESGEIQVSGEEIKTAAQKNVEFFLMDYADIETFWAGTVLVKPMNREALGRALSAFRTFRRYKYSSDYEGMLRRAEEVLQKSLGAKLEALVRTEPSGRFNIETVAVDA